MFRAPSRALTCRQNDFVPLKGWGTRAFIEYEWSWESNQPETDPNSQETLHIVAEIEREKLFYKKNDHTTLQL